MVPGSRNSPKRLLEFDVWPAGHLVSENGDRRKNRAVLRCFKQGKMVKNFGGFAEKKSDKLHVVNHGKSMVVCLIPQVFASHTVILFVLKFGYAWMWTICFVTSQFE